MPYARKLARKFAGEYGHDQDDLFNAAMEGALISRR
jgi:hypothetical protein